MNSRVEFHHAVVGALVSLVVACGNGPSAIVLVEGGTAPPDGSEGVCCPVSMGGCADPGGYSKDGRDCHRLCDGMCNQRIVVGDRGCRKLEYTPCSQPRLDGGTFDAGESDAASD